MSTLKLLNRDEYTLDQALDYLEKFHNEKRIDKSYLLYHARKGNLKTVIRLDIFRDFSGGENKSNCKAKIISLNNKKQVDDIYYLKDGSTQIIFEKFNINEETGHCLNTISAIHFKEIALIFNFDSAVIMINTFK